MRRRSRPKSRRTSAASTAEADVRGRRAARRARGGRGVARRCSRFRDGRQRASAGARVRRFSAGTNGCPTRIDPGATGTSRARAAVLGVLDELADAFERHDDRRRRHEDVTCGHSSRDRSADVHAATRHGRRAPGRRGGRAIRRIRSRAPGGLVETDWPERMRRSIFYTTGLLKGSAGRRNRIRGRRTGRLSRSPGAAGADAAAVTAFQLEGDAIVALSPMVEAGARLPRRAAPVAPRAASSTMKSLDRRRVGGARPSIGRGGLAAIAPRAAGTDRRRATAASSARRRRSAYRVSRVDHYVDCPFKYFAESVLRLPEERDETSGLTPLERGMLVHELFEEFYANGSRTGRRHHRGDAAGGRSRDSRRSTETALAGCRRPIARSSGRGCSARSWRRAWPSGCSSSRPTPAATVARRLLEFELNGPFTFPRLGGLRTRTIEIAGKADRIDIFDDGSLRVVDYKLGRDAGHGSRRFRSRSTRTRLAVAAGASGTADRIRSRAAMYSRSATSDEFEGGSAVARRGPGRRCSRPARPNSPARRAHRGGGVPAQATTVGQCEWCRYAGVCRKEYRPRSERLTNR